MTIVILSGTHIDAMQIVNVSPDVPNELNKLLRDTALLRPLPK